MVANLHQLRSLAWNPTALTLTFQAHPSPRPPLGPVLYTMTMLTIPVFSIPNRWVKCCVVVLWVDVSSRHLTDLCLQWTTSYMPVSHRRPSTTKLGFTAVRQLQICGSQGSTRHVAYLIPSTIDLRLSADHHRLQQLPICRSPQATVFHNVEQGLCKRTVLD